MPNDPQRLTSTRPSSQHIVVHSPKIVPPIAGYGRMIARQTIIVDSPDVGLLDDPDAVAFENLTISFALDIIGGAAFVTNDDNWGIGPSGLHAQLFWDKGATGAGVRIGIADSGLDLAHPTFDQLRLSKRLSGFAEFDKQGKKRVQLRADGTVIPDSQATPTFSHWHGTHCAGILVGTPTGGKARGMAPDADLAVTRVLEQANEGSVAGIAAGLWWLVDQNCDIVSLSLGWPGKHEEWAEPVLELLKRGVVVVAAVGNEFGLPGVEPSRSPANYPILPTLPSDGILVRVGAHDASGVLWAESGGEIADWSQVTVKGANGSTRASRFAGVAKRSVPDLLAPGVDIISSVPNDKYFSSPGSSMAAPHISGLLALTLSLLRKNQPAATPREAADIMLGALKPVANPNVQMGGGLVDVATLIAACP